jgi:hypothetical protein
MSTFFLENSDEDKEKLKYISLFFIVLFIGLAVEPFEKGPFDICIFKNLTNLPCPGCGLTRSCVYLAHGDLYDSLRMNPFGIIFFAAWAWVSLKDLVWLASRKRFPFPPRPIWSRSKTIFIFALLAFGIVRIFFHLNEFDPLHGWKNLLALI